MAAICSFCWLVIYYRLPVYGEKTAVLWGYKMKKARRREKFLHEHKCAQLYNEVYQTKDERKPAGD